MPAGWAPPCSVLACVPSLAICWAAGAPTAPMRTASCCWRWARWLNLLGFYVLRLQATAMLALCGTLGLLFFAIVTMSTMRLLRLAQQHCPGSDAVAAGLNIAAFNLGTAAGGALGGLLIGAQGLPSIALGGMAAALLAMALLWQRK